MGREIKRVPLDFEWPLNKTWQGYLRPGQFNETPCPDCRNGYSPDAQHLFDLWYGHLPFDPRSSGSTPLRYDTPAVRERAERNVAYSPGYYGDGERAVIQEGQRLADLWNRCWSHHLTQEDVDALVAGNRLWDFTRTWTRETGWQDRNPPVVPTAEQVNEWSLNGIGHDSINASVVIRARCERMGVGDTCQTCGGHASLEAYPGQRAEAEQWKATEPPEGDGWQLWETVSEGSPISPVFGSPEGLARWMSSPAYTWGAASPMRYEDALWVVHAGWSPTFMVSAGGLVSGEVFVGAATVTGGDTTAITPATSADIGDKEDDRQ